MWKLHQSETPPGNLHFAIHPWVVSTERLKSRRLAPAAHDQRQTFEIAMRARGALPEAGTAPVKPPAGTPVGV